MSTYADTSFLYSLYVQQAHSAAAAAYVASTGRGPLSITSLNRFELCNAVRLSVFRKLLDKRTGEADLRTIEQDIASGVLSLVSCDWVAVHAKAEELSAARTIKGGHRTMDLLHVASALVLKASGFLTFDQNQAALAGLVGLVVKP